MPTDLDVKGSGANSWIESSRLQSTNSARRQVRAAAPTARRSASNCYASMGVRTKMGIFRVVFFWYSA